MTMKEYTKEFYKINLRVGYIEDTEEKIARYQNGLKFDIQDELSLVSPTSVDEAYQYALKVEDRIQRMMSNRGKYGARGRRGQSGGKGKAINQQEGSISTQQRHLDNDNRGERIALKGGRGRIGGRGDTYQCYRCNKLGHISFEFLDNEEARHGEAHVV